MDDTTAAPGPSSQVVHRITRMLWCVLFVVLMTVTGGLSYSMLGFSRAINQLLTVLIVLVALLRWPLIPVQGSIDRPRLFALLYREWIRLNPVALVAALGWIVCLGLATQYSSIPGLSREVAGFYCWNLLLCALMYGHAARHKSGSRHLMAALLMALDIAIAVGVGQYANYWADPQRDMSWHAQHNIVVSLLNDTNHFGLYLAMLLPFALWDAREAAHPRPASPGIKSTWQNTWALWRAARPGVVVALGVATSSRSCLLGFMCGTFFFLGLLAITTRRNGAPTKSVVHPFVPALVIALILSIGAVKMQGEWFRMRAAQTAQAKDFQDSGRGSIWRNTLYLARERPTHGWGPGTFAANYPQRFQAHQLRELALEAHNIYLHRFMEEGAAALACWLLFVLVIWAGGLRAWARLTGAGHATPNDATDGNHSDAALAAATASALVASGAATVFVMPEQTPILTVHFYAMLALLAALARGSAYRINADVNPSYLMVHLVRLTIVCAVAGVVFNAPYLLRGVQAQLLFDDAIQKLPAAQRVTLLRQAKDLDTEQPAYWAQLAWAEFQLHGIRAKPAIIGYYKAALRRSPNDSVHWHNIAMLCLMTGDYANAINNEKTAVRLDPTFYYYREQLAYAYVKAGQPALAQEQRDWAKRCLELPIFNYATQPSPNSCQLPMRYRRMIKQPEIIVPEN